MPNQDAANMLTLEDGRHIAYSSFSASSVPSSVAHTILFFHGAPGSDPEGGVIKSHATKYNANIIGISRPGYGKSTLQPNRTILDWPKDVLQVADHLGIEQFSIVAFSGGGPFAVACLAAIPQSRLCRVAIVSGMWPGHIEKNETLFMARIIHWAAVTPVLSTILPYVLDLAVGRSARNTQKAADFETRFVQDVGSRHAMEAQCLTNHDVRRGFVESTREAFRNGAHGWTAEAALLVSDWNIPFESIDGTRLDIWHGSEDENVPSRLAVEASNAITGCRLHVTDGEAHLSTLANCADRILDELLSDRHASE